MMLHNFRMKLNNNDGFPTRLVIIIIIASLLRQSWGLVLAASDRSLIYLAVNAARNDENLASALLKPSRAFSSYVNG